MKDKQNKLSRRNFVKFAGATIAGSALRLPRLGKRSRTQENLEQKTNIASYRTLGRTGFKASDIGMGTTRLKESSVIRYAYDRGVNYFDTAEGYSDGLSERLIGETMQFMDRSKIFLTTKLKIGENERKEKIIERLKKCLTRLKTDYVNALFTHMPPTADYITHPGFHAATKELKSEGRVKFTGISSHGPRTKNDDSMEKILCGAAEDGRFDLILHVHNFLNTTASDKIIAACKKNNVGITAMKTLTGALNVPAFDPDNPTEEQQKYLDRILKRGTSKEKAVARLQRSIERQQKRFEKSKPFIEKYGINTKVQLHKACIQWAISNPDVHTTLVSMRSFDLVDMAMPLSGTKLSATDRKFLYDYKYTYGDLYCRHGCRECAVACANDVPVSTIMRYAYYYETHGIEKYAMQQYHNLNENNGMACESCDAACANACPYGLDVQGQLVQAHSLLTLV